MIRKLASVQRVLEILPIVGADAIELVRVNGWQCVTKKGEFQVGDLGVFLEIDAVPPDTDAFRFLWTPKSGEMIARPEKFRIRSMKLRGALSQGLFMPLETFDWGGVAVSEGEDVTQALGVSKYDPPLPMSGEIRAAFPGVVPKTDEERVQSAPGVLDELRGRAYVATLKCDGTSATFVIDPEGEFHVCGRNYSIAEGENAFWRVARTFELERILRRTPHLAVQGELCGPGIQKNRLGLTEPGLFVFNVYDWRAGRHFDDSELRAWCDDNGLTPVTIVERGDNFAHTQESLLSLAEGKYANTSNEREGLVIRPQREMRSDVLGGRLSFKVISNRFLLKEGE